MPTDDGPRFLDAPPLEPPRPARTEPVIVVPPKPSPYREPGRPIAADPPPRRPAATPAPVAAASEELGPLIGDAAGEHLYMDHGKYGAWMYVVVAFAMETALFALPGVALGDWLVRLGTAATVIQVVSVGVGAILAYRVFRDRWRCIETYASGFCSGVMNLSMLYVPFVALVYANVRGVAKLRGN